LLCGDLAFKDAVKAVMHRFFRAGFRKALQISGEPGQFAYLGLLSAVISLSCVEALKRY